MRFLTRTFIDPWRSKERSKTMLAGIIGGFAVCILCLTLSYTIAGKDLQTNLIFQILRQSVTGLFGIGFSFHLLSKSHPRLRILLFQFTGVLLFAAGPTQAITCALGYACIASPFWATYNIRFALQQSHKNNGREIALGMLLMLLMGSAGTWIGGFLLETDRYTTALVTSLSLLIAATQMLLVPYDTSNIPRNAIKLIGKRGPSSRMTFFSGILGTFQDSCLPAWFRIMGMSPLSAGTMLALQPILGFLFTPVIGHLVQKGTLRSIRVGGVIVFVGWALMIATVSNPWLLAPTLGLLSVSANLISATEATRWYKIRTPTAITAREYLLALGRAPAFALALPIAFMAPIAYPLVVIGVSSLFIFGVRKLKRSDLPSFSNKKTSETI